MVNNKKDKKFIYLPAILILLIIFIFSFAYAQVQSEAVQEVKETKSWFSGIIDFFKSLFNSIFQAGNAVENATGNIGENLSGNEINLNETEKSISAEKPQDEFERYRDCKSNQECVIASLSCANTSMKKVAINVKYDDSILQEQIDKCPTCGQVDGGTRDIVYTCVEIDPYSETVCKNNKCYIKGEKTLIEGSNITNASNTTCGYCQYMANDSCLNYECCKDEECGINQTCAEHTCVNIEEKCPSCPSPYISPKTGNICEYYYCNASTYRGDPPEFFCIRKDVRPCCGNNECEVSKGENEENCQADCANISKFLYCETDKDCAECCGSKGRCMNINYSCSDYPTYFSPNLCGKEAEFNCYPCECVNNQCTSVFTGIRSWC